MATLDELRSIVLALPETTEGTHFRLPAFRVIDKGFIGLEKGGDYVLMRMDKPAIQALVNEDPATYGEMWQSGKHLIGVRFSLADVSVEKLRELVEQSWRSMAPKKLLSKRG